MEEGIHGLKHNATSPDRERAEPLIQPSSPLPPSASRRDWKRLFWKLSKYGMLGVLAVSVRVAMFYFFSQWWPSDKRFLELSDTQRAWNHFIANGCAFFFSNLVAYAGNALWVFEGGRHTRRREFVIFTLVSLIGWGIGNLFGPGVIALFGISDEVALFNVILVSLIVNYLGRRHLVFLR